VVPAETRETDRASQQRFLTTREVAEMFDVSSRMVRRWCEDQRVRASRTPGGHWRIPAEQFRATPEQLKHFTRTIEEMNERFDDPPPEDYE